LRHILHALQLPKITFYRDKKKPSFQLQGGGGVARRHLVKRAFISIKRQKINEVYINSINHTCTLSNSGSS
jgi:hypothetical protein